MFSRFLNRSLDIVVAIIALIVFSPVLIIIALCVKFDGTGGPVFVDINNRLGKDKKLFRMYKFRSMVPNAHIIIRTDPRYKDLYKKWLRIGKLEINEDPRITKIGRFIRKTDLDEFPQFLNVLKGEMSVVGPRASYADELDRYCEEYPKIKAYLKDVYSIKPGITGVWQISGRNEISMVDRYKMDAVYAKKKSFFLDLKVMIMTPIVMITRRGAFE